MFATVVKLSEAPKTSSITFSLDKRLRDLFCKATSYTQAEKLRIKAHIYFKRQIAKPKHTRYVCQGCYAAIKGQVELKLKPA